MPLLKKSRFRSLSTKGTDQTNAITIAYFIMVHRMPDQFEALFQSIYDKSNIYLVHIDKKAEVETANAVRHFLAKFSNAYVSESESVTWGGYSMVKAELNGMKMLLDLKKDWDYFINLSGQDYPLKSQPIIKDFLRRNLGNSYLKFLDQASSRPETMNRIENFFIERDGGIAQTSLKRPFMANKTPFIGGQWMILTRSCCDFICNSKEVLEFEQYYSNTLIPDESFFQTVLMNTTFDGIVVNDDKRAIIWIADGVIKLRPKTFTISDIAFLKSGENLFARKFDFNIDRQIIEKLRSHYTLPLLSRLSISI